ncbi:MAG TPA: ABC transporter permease [Thermomicrobiales bacterium]|nr:ABC transporter permease [Thermomicrobiales bacterium]
MAQQTTNLEQAAPAQPRTLAESRVKEREIIKESPGFYTRAWRKLRRDKIAMVALFFTIIIMLFSFGAPVVERLTGQDPITGNYTQVLRPPFESTENILGTDNNGRDILTRLAYGGRISMTVAVLSLAVALVIGSTVGSVAGFFGGAIDNLLMRFVDVIISIPGITLLLLLSVWFRPGPVGLAFVIAALSWTGVSRLIRGEVLSLKNRDFVDAARVTGASNRQIITRHIFPNVISIVIVWASLSLPSLILYEATLSYLGFGVQIPTPSWGNMLDDSRQYFTQAWTFAFFPGFMIFVSALCINLLGNGLRDALDPRLND